MPCAASTKFIPTYAISLAGENRMGRITGPEPEGAWQTATDWLLILATPTVDIGYNFEKINKVVAKCGFSGLRSPLWR